MALPLSFLLLAAVLPASALEPECSAAWATRAVAAALEVYGGCGAAWAAFHHKKLFPAGVPKARAEAVLSAPDPAAWPGAVSAAALTGEYTPITQEMVRRGARHLGQALLVEKSITASCGTQPGVAGGWSRDPNAKDRLAGELRLSDMRVDGVAKAPAAERNTCAYHCNADDLGNTVLHEVSHMLTDYFTTVYGAKPDLGDFRETLSYSYPAHWNGEKPLAGIYKSGYCEELGGENGQIVYRRNPPNTRGYKGDEETARRVAQTIPRHCPDALKLILGL